MNRHKTWLIATLTAASCIALLSGCLSRSLSAGKSAAAILADPSHEDLVVKQIEEGQKDFLFSMGDGTFYPVKLEKAEFLETMPLKIKVNFFYRHKVVAVPVTGLIRSAPLPVGCTVEQWQQQNWQPATGAAWDEEKQLWFKGDTALPEAEVRIVCTEDNKKGE